MKQRMNQRGITGDMVALVGEFGDWRDNRLVLDRRGLTEAVRSLDRLRGRMLKALDKGGLAVVELNGRQVTTYSIRDGCRK
jgi:ferric-dicitrate binding protein FerR (iron transport regulator)